MKIYKWVLEPRDIKYQIYHEKAHIWILYNGNIRIFNPTYDSLKNYKQWKQVPIEEFDELDKISMYLL